MAQKLENANKQNVIPVLENAKAKPFRVTFEVQLTNGYEVKDMKQADIKELHKFLEETVYKNLSISVVDKKYLRKQGMSNAPPVMYGDMELYHYGRDRSPFRIFGYYNEDEYFVVCRIDGSHQTHK